MSDSNIDGVGDLMNNASPKCNFLEKISQIRLMSDNRVASVKLQCM